MDIEKAQNIIPTTNSDNQLPARYQQPSNYSKAGRLDRQREAGHVLKMRDLQRDFIENTAQTAKTAAEHQHWLDAQTKELTLSKLALMHAHHESQIMAAGDPVLQAQFAVLDDNALARLRLRLNDPHR